MTAPQPTNLPQDTSLFQLLVEQVRDYAIFALDSGGRIVSWNAGAQNIKGYASEEILGESYGRFFTEEDRAAGVPARLLREAAERGSVTVEGWRVRKNGERFRALAVLTALHSDDGTLTGFGKVTRDVTESHLANEALRMRERQLADAQDVAGLGSWVWEVDSDRVTWTEKLFEMYGLDPSVFDASFAGYLARVHPDDRERVKGIVEGAYRNGGAFDFEERIVRPDGNVRVLRSRGRAMQDDSGRTVRLMGACVDITEARQAEAQASRLAAEQVAREALEGYAAGLRFLTRASELLASSLDYEGTLRTVAELAVPDVADWCAVDLVDGPDTLRRVAVEHSDQSKVRLAYELAEQWPDRESQSVQWQVIERREPVLLNEISDAWLAETVQDPERLALARQLGLQSAVIVPLPGRNGSLGTLTLVHAESGRHFGEDELRLVEELGRHAGLAIDNARLHRDLEGQNQVLEEQAAELEQQTEELQNQAHHLDELMSELEVSNEELLQRSEEAESANRAKSEFLATMSHELRTPLNAIFGYADLLDLGLHGPITVAQHEALERIKKNQRALLVLVNDVLNFAKLEAGKLELTPTNVPVAEIVADVAAVVAPQLEAKGLRYRAEPFDDGIRVHAEQERVEQVLLNLLTNAGKFTKRGGEVVVSIEEGDDVVHLRVRDTGVGIPAERLQAVFDPFVQIDRQVEDTGERGVGLGLAISRDLAVAMGGGLTATSTVGEGSTFTLTLRRGVGDANS